MVAQPVCSTDDRLMQDHHLHATYRVAALRRSSRSAARPLDPLDYSSRSTVRPPDPLDPSDRSRRPTARLLDRSGRSTDLPPDPFIRPTVRPFKRIAPSDRLSARLLDRSALVTPTTTTRPPCDAPRRSAPSTPLAPHSIVVASTPVLLAPVHVIVPPTTRHFMTTTTTTTTATTMYDISVWPCMQEPLGGLQRPSTTCVWPCMQEPLSGLQRPSTKECRRPRTGFRGRDPCAAPTR